MQIFFNTLKIIFSLSLPILLGYLICEVILYKKFFFSFLQKLALGYGIGMGVLSVAMFSLSLLKIKFSVLSITFSLLIVAVPFLLAHLKSNRISKNRLDEKQQKRAPFFHKLLIGIIIAVFLFVLLQALIIPLAAWDSWAIYGFKAKAFYIEKTVTIDFLNDTTKSYSHPDYPLLVPLIETWIYICLGGWNDQLVKILFPLYFISLIIIFYNNLKYYIDKKYSLLFTSFFITIPQFISLGSNGYADLPLIFYYFTSFVFLLKAYNNLDKRMLFISAMFAGFAAWTKNEGLVLSIFNVIILAAMIIIQRKINRRNIIVLLEYSLVILLIIIPWICLKKSLGIANDVVNGGNFNLASILNNLKKLPIILSWFGKEIIVFKSWNLLWVFSLAIITFNFKRIFIRPILFIFLSLFFYLGIWVFIYIISPYDINWHLATSLNRLLLQITPSVLFLDGLLICQNLNI